MTDERAAPQQSDRRQLVDAALRAAGRGPLDHWIATQRAAGLSWAAISWAVRDITEHTVSYETLRRWSAQDHEEAPPNADDD